MQPGGGQKQCVLRTDGPETSQWMLIDPNHSLVQGGGVQIGVGRNGHQGYAMETRTFAEFEVILQLVEMIHRKRINLPVFRLLAAESDFAGDSLAFAANDLCEI